MVVVGRWRCQVLLCDQTPACLRASLQVRHVMVFQKVRGQRHRVAEALYDRIHEARCSQVL